jgi:hypothetical protein
MVLDLADRVSEDMLRYAAFVRRALLRH